MRTVERDYRYLLRRLLPYGVLRPEQRRALDATLATGSDAELRGQAISILEELAAQDYFERDSVEPIDGGVRVVYRRRGSNTSVTLTVPRAEWEGDNASQVSEVPSAPVATGERRAAPIVAQPTRYLSELVDTFSIGSRSRPLSRRVDDLLAIAENWLGISELRVLIDEEQLAGQAPSEERLQMASLEDVRAIPDLRRALETGVATYVSGEAQSHLGWSDGMVVASAVFCQGRIWGMVLARWEGTPIAGDETQITALVANLVRQLVDFDADLAERTSVDALTQVYNRHFFDQQLPVEIERATRSGSAVAMLMVDIDNFKRVNDELGHKRGDEALRAVADLVRGNLRKMDMPFRYGGEELVVLLPGTSEFESVHTAERLRRVIADYSGFRDNGGVARQITVSVGVSVYPATARSAEELFQQADAAMYQAKKQGKNRVVLFREQPTSS